MVETLSLDRGPGQRFSVDRSRDGAEARQDLPRGIQCQSQFTAGLKTDMFRELDEEILRRGVAGKFLRIRANQGKTKGVLWLGESKSRKVVGRLPTQR